MKLLLKILFTVIAIIIALFTTIIDAIFGTDITDDVFDSVSSFGDKIVNIITVATGWVIVGVAYVIDSIETFFNMLFPGSALLTVSVRVHIFNNLVSPENVRASIETIVNPIFQGLVNIRFCIESIIEEPEPIMGVNGPIEAMFSVTGSMKIIEEKATGINLLHLMICPSDNCGEAIPYKNYMIVDFQCLDETIIHEFGHLCFLFHREQNNAIMRQRPRTTPFVVNDWERAKFRGHRFDSSCPDITTTAATQTAQMGLTGGQLDKEYKQSLMFEYLVEKIQKIDPKIVWQCSQQIREGQIEFDSLWILLGHTQQEFNDAIGQFKKYIANYKNPEKNDLTMDIWWGNAYGRYHHLYGKVKNYKPYPSFCINSKAGYWSKVKYLSDEFGKSPLRSICYIVIAEYLTHEDSEILILLDMYVAEKLDMKYSIPKGFSELFLLLNI